MEAEKEQSVLPFCPQECNPKRHDFTKNYLKTCNIPTCYTAFATNRNPVDL